jgi:hypothetical protein
MITLVSYQGIASAMPQPTPINVGFTRWANSSVHQEIL